jgi:hypothetical protein
MTTSKFKLLAYMSPTTDRSLFKGIPIEYLETVRKMMYEAGLGKTYRFRFRGPRPRGYQAYLPKQMATHFAVYLYG